MTRFLPAGVLASASMLALSAPAAQAHAIAGARVFATTLTIDDPAVADEASLPTFSWQRSGAQGGPGPVHDYEFGGEFDKRITARLGIGINDGFSVVSTENDKVRTGAPNLAITLKYQLYINPAHEFIAAAGVIREFGGTGSAKLGADDTGSTTPTLYAGKGFGDLPIGYLRPFAVTGTFGYAISDRALKLLPATDGGEPGFNNGLENRWTGGISLQYSIPYLQEQVKNLGLPDFVGRLVPLVEVSWSSPATRPSATPTQLVYAPGIIYLGDSYQVGVEALIPGNRASGTNVGVIAQFHMFFDDMFPNSLGKPLFSS